MDTPTDKRKESKLFICTGVHDGYTGSVPITHSLNVYNKIVEDFNPIAADQLIPWQIISTLLTARSLPNGNYGYVGNKKIHYHNQFDDKVEIIVFEGGHEMIVDQALKHIQ